MRKIIAITLAAAALTVTACARIPKVTDRVTTVGTGGITAGQSGFPEKGPEVSPCPDDPMLKEAIMTFNPESVQTYENPLIAISNPRVWKDYGVGDPFVMRWNGRYYLYCSTKDGNVGIQCWTSDDLVNWEFETICAKESVTMTAYAPEVVYYNGYFYMYTSPAGNGHYVLRSESPTGPFKAVTENFGHSIDGSVFIDDNGRWYFYSADGGGIKVYTMSAPDAVAQDGSNTGAFMNGWTEGPMVVKVGGRYYLTYTGNHVWCNGYRINYATSTRSPTSFTAGENNPLLLNTLGSLRGIGHSSTVMGPNMDSYYIVYHASLGAPKREMRADRLVFNGSRMLALGPTTTAQQKPEMPDLYCRFTSADDLSGWHNYGASVADGRLTLSDGGWVLAESAVGQNYTAECNVLSVSGGRAGMVFGYTDSGNYGTACFDPGSQKLIVTFVVNGQATVHEKALAKSFGEDVDFTKLQLLTVRKDGRGYTFLVNNRTLCEYESDLPTGAFGAAAEGGSADFGFMGITGQSNQSSVKRYYKPVPGVLEGITCVEDGIETVSADGTALVKLDRDGHLNYTVNIDRTGGYDLAVRYRSEVEVTLAFYENGKQAGTLTLPSTFGKDGTQIFRNLPLSAGMKAITFVCTSGSAQIGQFAFDYHAAVETLDEDFSKSTAPAYTDGGWTVSGGKLNLTGDSVGKRLYGSENWGDYIAEADITVTGNFNFGMLVRAANPSVGGAGDDVNAGADFVQGYFIGIDGGNLVLGRQNYGWESLKTVNFAFEKNRSYHMKVEAVGATVRVFIDGNLLLEYTDADPFMQGMVGFRGHYSSASVDNFKVTPQ